MVFYLKNSVFNILPTKENYYFLVDLGVMNFKELNIDFRVDVLLEPLVYSILKENYSFKNINNFNSILKTFVNSYINCPNSSIRGFLYEKIEFFLFFSLFNYHLLDLSQCSFFRIINQQIQENNLTNENSKNNNENEDDSQRRNKTI